MSETARLALWLALVGIFIVLQYTTHVSTKNRSAPLYHWTFALESLAQELVVLAIVLAIAGFDLRFFALNRPQSLGRTAALAGGAFVAINVFELVYTALVHPGNEQGLTPSHWQPAHAGAYIANGIVICTVVPIVEELTFRGLGFALLEPFGNWFAIIAVGVLFGLAHGLVLELPVIAAFGCVLAWIRSRTASVYPGMVLHASFNAIALVLAVTISSSS
jgi:uncharacterized protein